MKTEVIWPPKIHQLMTGVLLCEKGPETTRLIYPNGKTETVKTADLPATINWENWFSIVGGIQSLRKAGTPDADTKAKT